MPLAEAIAIASSTAARFSIPRKLPAWKARLSFLGVPALVAIVAVLWFVLRGMSSGSLPSNQPRKPDVRRAAATGGPPFELVAIVLLEEPRPRRQAVLRDKQSGEYLRVFEGDTIYLTKRSREKGGENLRLSEADTILGDYCVVSITADVVTIVDSKGRHYKLAGRLGDK